MKTECTRFAVTLDDGAVAILSFLTLARGGSLPDGASWVDRAGGWWSRPASDALVFGEITRAFPPQTDAGQALPGPVSWRQVEDGEIPEDRTYRDALVDDGKALVHSMAKAREVHRQMLRHARAPALAALDVEAMRADEAGDAKRKADVVTEKQRLRDVTRHPAIQAASSVEELKAVTLGIL